jgi:transitional endoplasmic reticulum ATPase
LRALARETIDLAGSDIEFLCRKASMLAIREYINKASGTSGPAVKKPQPATRKSQLLVLKRHFEEAMQLVQKQKASIYAGQDDL